MYQCLAIVLLLLLLDDIGARGLRSNSKSNLDRRLISDGSSSSDCSLDALNELLIMDFFDLQKIMIENCNSNNGDDARIMCISDKNDYINFFDDNDDCNNNIFCYEEKLQLDDYEDDIKDISKWNANITDVEFKWEEEMNKICIVRVNINKEYIGGSCQV